MPYNGTWICSLYGHHGQGCSRNIKRFKKRTADADIQLGCDDDDSNIFKWTALIKGPSETPYEGGVFQLAFAVPEQYALQPPQVRFLTKIFHPNVHFKVIFCVQAMLRGYQSMARMYTRRAAMPKKG